MALSFLRSRTFWLRFGAAALSAALLAGAIAGPPLYRIALLGSGYMAQGLCSGIFVSGRSLDEVMAQDLSGPGLEPLQLFTPHVDETAQTVSAAAFGLAGQTSIYRDGLGCTLLHGKSAKELRAQTKDLFPGKPAPAANAPWPEGDRVDADARDPYFQWPDDVNGAAASHALDAIFAERNTRHRRGTRALVVVHKGRIVAERYARGFDATMPLIGWSMSKTAMGALIGQRIAEGALALEDAKLMPQWRDPGDPRSAITADDLMRMISGLAFDEDADDKLSDLSQMMYVKSDPAAFAASKPLVYKPGAHFSYSTGTTMILSAVLRETFDEERDYLRYPRKRLFEPLGMRSAEFAPDASGTLVGGAFLYASARDWARLGLLFLSGGNWLGSQVLPRDWVGYMTRPTLQSEDGEYGAQLWLKLEPSNNGGEPPMPEDGFYMIGHQGQVVAMIPSKDLVIVRLGLTPSGGDWDPARDLAPLVNAFPNTTRETPPAKP